MRTLHVEAREGASVASLLGALLDLGVAPSLLLEAVADLDLGVELHLEPGRVERVPDEAEALVRPGEMMHDLAPLAADALGRLVVHALRGDARAAVVDAGTLALLHATAVAVEQLAPDVITVGEVGPATPDALALLAALAPEGAGESEPAWVGDVVRGHARTWPPMGVALGDVSSP